MNLLQRASLRYLLRHPAQLLLAVAGIALGVAMIIGIDLANQSARAGFELSREAITGRASHRIVGGPSGIDESVYVKLAMQAGVHAAPRINGRALLLGEQRRAVDLLGIDPFTEAPFETRLTPGQLAGDIDFNHWLTQPNSVIIGADLARQLSLQRGASLAVAIGGHQKTLHIAGIIEARDSVDRALGERLIVDIATAQELLGLHGRLSTIDLRLSDPELEPLLRRQLPDGSELLTAAAASQHWLQMTRAFRLNLTAMSLLALLVGVFLIYNTMSFLVLQRRRLFGLLRVSGVTRGQLGWMVLREALTIGAVGTALGIALGIPLASGLLQLVARTIDDLYFSTAVTGLSVEALSLFKGIALGMLGTLVAAAAPAIEAARANPVTALSRASLETRSRALASVSAVFGLALLACATVTLLAGNSLTAGFAGIFLVITGAAAMVPLAIHVSMRITHYLLQRTGRRGSVLPLAVRGVSASLSRTGVAAAALAVAVATVISVSTMISSFRGSVSDWLSHSLRADFYLTVSGATADGLLNEALAADLLALPQVADISLSRYQRMETRHGPITLWSLAIGDSGWRGFELLAGDAESARSAFMTGDAVIISEPFAYHQQLRVGDTIALPALTGYRDVPVAGIFRDYSSDSGVVVMQRDAYIQHFADTSIGGIGIYLSDSSDSDAFGATLRQRFAEQPGISVVANRELRESSLHIFDRTFAITHVLRLLAGLVAFAGITSALLAWQLERGRELGVLRAVGFTPAQLSRLLTTQSGILGAVTGLLAMPLGAALAALLVFVINRRSFGWSMQLEFQAAAFAEGLLLAVIAALLAGWYPAHKAAVQAPALAVREE